jgi:RNA polymerase sigma-70 factor (ECF subfamily)
MIDRARRNRVVPIDLREDLDSLNVLVDEVTPERRTSIREQLVHVTEAINRLPVKCREVLWLRRVENLSGKETAARLNVSEGTVEKHLARASQLLTDYLSQAEGTERPSDAADLIHDDIRDEQ